MNHGVILEQIRDTDFIFGANSISPSITTDGDWFKWYSVGELQYGAYFDTYGCVTFSGLNTIEAVMNYQLAHNMISSANVAWLTEKGYIVNGQMNCSDRFNYKMSGTDPHAGNTGNAVWNSFRHHGIVPEKVWTWKRDSNIPYEERFVEWFNSEIPQEVKELGLEFLKRFDIFYEYVSKADFAQSLTHSPIQVFIPTGCPEVDEIAQYCPNAIGHAVSMCRISETRYDLFDHYLKSSGTDNEKFIRKVSKDYKFHPFGYITHIKQKDTMNTLIKGDKRPEIYAVGADGLARHIYSMKTLAEGVKAGFWEEYNQIKHEKPQAQVDALPKGQFDVTFSI